MLYFFISLFLKCFCILIESEGLARPPLLLIYQSYISAKYCDSKSMASVMSVVKEEMFPLFHIRYKRKKKSLCTSAWFSQLQSIFLNVVKNWLWAMSVATKPFSPPLSPSVLLSCFLLCWKLYQVCLPLRLFLLHMPHTRQQPEVFSFWKMPHLWQDCTLLLWVFFFFSCSFCLL